MDYGWLASFLFFWPEPGVPSGETIQFHRGAVIISSKEGNKEKGWLAQRGGGGFQSVGGCAI